MNCRKTLKLIPLYLTPHESWLKPKERAALEAHLAVCDSCSQDCEETREVVEFLRKYWPYISEDTQALIDEANSKEKEQQTAKTVRISQILMKVEDPLRWVASVAAVIIICLGIVRAFWANNAEHIQPIVQDNIPQKQAITQKITVTENGVAVSASHPITTDSQIRELLINNRHQLVMNRYTTLSIDSFVSNEKLGCLVNLNAGRICSHVEPDGNPFEVLTPHGKAVITGTVFDVSVTKQETTLIVAEGSVRFESSQGRVDVGAGFQSTLQAQSKPSAPTKCDAKSLMALANGTETNPASEKPLVDSDYANFLEMLPLQLSYPGRPIDLEAIDYEEWVDSKRKWFNGQFPWIFELQEALMEKALLATSHDSTELVEVQSLTTVTVPDYPELLIKTGDIWQIVYPNRVHRIISVLNPDLLLSVSKEYGLDESWLDQTMESPGEKHTQRSAMAFGVSALEKWLEECRRLRIACDSEKEFEAFREYSQAIGEYLENTRTLLWLSVRNNKCSVAAEHKPETLKLLRQQVVAAHTCKEMVWYLSLSKTEDYSGRNEYLLRLLDTNTEMVESERILTKIVENGLQ